MNIVILLMNIRDIDKHHLIFFINCGKRIGVASYCIYKSEDGKCFILDFWIFKEYRNNNFGHLCLKKLEEYTKQDGARYHEINANKEESIRLWKSLGVIKTDWMNMEKIYLLENKVSISYIDVTSALYISYL